MPIDLSMFAPPDEQRQPESIESTSPMQIAMGKMRAYGWSPEVSAGIVGNLFHESAGTLKGNVWGDGGNSFGLAQWNGPRRKALAEYATQRGVPADDLDLQIEFLNHELLSNYGHVADRLRGSKNPEQAARIFSEGYENPDKPMMDRRINAAKKAYGYAQNWEESADKISAAIPEKGNIDLSQFAPPEQQKPRVDLSQFAPPEQQKKPVRPVASEADLEQSVMAGAPETRLAQGSVPVEELATGAKLGLMDLAQRAAKVNDPSVTGPAFGYFSERDSSQPVHYRETGEWSNVTGPSVVREGPQYDVSKPEDRAKATGDRLLKELFPQGIPEAKGMEGQVIRGIAESWPGLLALASLQPLGAPAAFGLWGLTEEEPLTGAAKGAALGGTLKGVSKLTEYVKDPVMQWFAKISGGAGVGGGATAIAGGKPEEITRDALIFGLFEAAGMPRKAKPEAWFKEKGVSPEDARTMAEADIYSPEFAQAVNRAGMKLALPWPERMGETFEMRGRPEEVISPYSPEMAQATRPPLALPPGQGFEMREPTPEVRRRPARPPVWETGEYPEVYEKERDRAVMTVETALKRDGYSDEQIQQFMGSLGPKQLDNLRIPPESRVTSERVKAAEAQQTPAQTPTIGTEPVPLTAKSVAARSNGNIQTVQKQVGSNVKIIEMVSDNVPDFKVVIHPSTYPEHQGRWQATLYEKGHPISHANYDSWEDAVRGYSGESHKSDDVPFKPYTKPDDFNVSKVFGGKQQSPAPAPAQVPIEPQPPAPPSKPPATAEKAAEASASKGKIINLSKIKAEIERDKEFKELEPKLQEAWRKTIEEMSKKGWQFVPEKTDWRPLELVIDKDEIGRFMFMGKFPHEGKELYSFKDSVTRKYLTLDDDGNSYKYLPDQDKYIKTNLKEQFNKLDFYPIPPWEVRRFDYANRGIPERKIDRFNEHKQFVEKALNEKFVVPDAVLKDYPDLSAKYAKAEPEKPVAAEGKGGGEETVKLNKDIEYTTEKVTVPPKEQKEYAIDRVQDAIKKHPLTPVDPRFYEDRKSWQNVVSDEIPPDGPQYIAFDVPGDGSFKIRNSLKALITAESYFKKWPTGKAVKDYLPGKAHAVKEEPLSKEQQERLINLFEEGKLKAVEAIKQIEAKPWSSSDAKENKIWKRLNEIGGEYKVPGSVLYREAYKLLSEKDLSQLRGKAAMGLEAIRKTEAAQEQVMRERRTEPTTIPEVEGPELVRPTLKEINDSAMAFFQKELQKLSGQKGRYVVSEKSKLNKKIAELKKTGGVDLMAYEEANIRDIASALKNNQPIYSKVSEMSGLDNVYILSHNAHTNDYSVWGVQKENPKAPVALTDIWDRMSSGKTPAAALINFARYFIDRHDFKSDIAPKLPKDVVKMAEFIDQAYKDMQGKSIGGDYYRAMDEAVSRGDFKDALYSAKSFYKQYPPEYKYPEPAPATPPEAKAGAGEKPVKPEGAVPGNALYSQWQKELATYNWKQSQKKGATEKAAATQPPSGPPPQERITQDITRANKFRQMADGLQKQIDAKFSPGVAQQRPTRRRAAMAESSYREGERLQKVQVVLRNMGDAIENGTLPDALQGVTSKKLIEELFYNHHTPTIDRGDVRDLLEWSKGAKGITKERNLVSLIPSKGETKPGTGFYHLTFPEIEALAAVAEKAKAPAYGSYTLKKHIERAQDYRRYIAAGIETELKWQRAHDAIAEMAAKKPATPKEVELKRQERELIGLQIPGFFPTPKETAGKMVEMADIKPGMEVLEPSAGNGNIADSIREKAPEAKQDVIEYNSKLAGILETKGHNVVGQDFLENTKKYDRIVMNPPFENGQDIDHVRHAYESLKPGGRLVSIMSEGPFFRGDKKATEFRNWFNEVGGTEEKLAEKTFAKEVRATGVNGRIVTIDKPPSPTKPGAVKMYSGGPETGPAIAKAVKAVVEDTANILKDAPRQTRDAYETIKEGGKNLWDWYRSPFETKERGFKKLLGEYLGARQIAGFENSKFLKKIQTAVPNRITREGITNWIQAGGDEAILRDRADKSKGNLKAGYEVALNLSPQEKAIAAEISTQFDHYLKEAQEAGILEAGLENYVNQLWRKEAHNKAELRKFQAEINAGLLNTNFNYAKKRVFDSYFEGEQAGYTPKNKDAAFLLGNYHQSMYEAIAARKAIRAMLDGKADDGRPLVSVSGGGKQIPSKEAPEAHLIRPKVMYAEAADGRRYRQIDHPALRKWKWVDKDIEGKPIFVQGDLYVHPDIYKHLKNVLSRSAIREHPVGRIALGVSQNLKGVLLSGLPTPFHQVHLGSHAIFHKINPFTAPELNFNDPIQRKAVEHGLMVYNHNALADFTEGLQPTGISRKIPGIGRVTQAYGEYLFQDLIPRLKMKLFKEAYERNTERYGKKYNDDQIAEITANQANAAFGELNYKAMGRNPTIQDMFRLLALAPDFLEARLRFAGQAVKPGGKEQFAALARGVIGMYGAGIIGNMLFSDDRKPHWDKPFQLIIGGKAYSMRSVPGDMIHLFSDPRSFVYHRLNPSTLKPTIEALMQRDVYGRKRNLGEQVGDYFRGVVPIPLQHYVSQGERTLLQSALQTMGGTSWKDKSSLDKIMQQYGETRAMLNLSPEDRAKSELKRKAQKMIRAGDQEKAIGELQKAIKEKKVDVDKAVDWMTEAQKPEQEVRFKAMPLDWQAKALLEATPEETKSLMPLMLDKIDRAKEEQLQKAMPWLDKLIKKREKERGAEAR